LRRTGIAPALHGLQSFLYEKVRTAGIWYTARPVLSFPQGILVTISEYQQRRNCLRAQHECGTYFLLHAQTAKIPFGNDKIGRAAQQVSALYRLCQVKNGNSALCAAAFRRFAAFYRVLAEQYRVLAIKYRVLAGTYRILAEQYLWLATKYRVLATTYRVLADRYRVLAG